MSFICLAFNITISIISIFAYNFFDGIILVLLSIIILFLPLVSLSGTFLGIGAVVLREPLMKSITSIILNVAYVFAYFYFLKY